MTIDHATDAALLKRFSERREEAAFAELVERHGPLVQRVCRRFLHNEHDVEEVFQATFLVLALRASEASWHASVGGWVQGVARRLALHARSENVRRLRREVHESGLPRGLHASECAVSAFDEVERREVRRAIDVAVEGLPEKYRAPLVLCYLEGLTNHEAAQQLGYPVGSISRRLERARGLLRKRLIGCGVMLGLLIGLVALGSRAADRQARRLEPVRAAMALIGAETSHRGDLRELIGPLERMEDDGAGSLGLDRLGRLAERAVLAADASMAFDPGPRRDAWRSYADEMKLAAIELARLDGDAPGREWLAGARRLNAACVQCHTAFH